MQIDPKKVQIFARCGFTAREIADHFQCAPETIRLEFAADIKRGRLQAKLILRQGQLEAAKRGNVTMLKRLEEQFVRDSRPQPVDILLEMAKKGRPTIRGGKRVEQRPDAADAEKDCDDEKPRF